MLPFNNQVKQMELRSYQNKVINQAAPILVKTGLVYLALDTRLGKTLIALHLAKFVCGAGTVLFITKKKVIGSIETDYRGSGLGIPIHIVSMDSLQNIRSSKPYTVIIVDEAHNFGAFPKPTKRAKELRRITAGQYCILLSATPCPESWSQIYHQLWACSYRDYFISMYKNFYAWAREYVNMVPVKDELSGETKFGFKQKFIGTGVTVNDYGDAKIEKIKERISPILITMTQAEAGFRFTEFEEEIITLPMPDKILEAYKVLKSDKYFLYSRVFGGDKEVVADNSAALFSKMHQLCGGTVITETGVLLLSSYKINEIIGLLAKYKKLAVYYKFIGEAELIYGYLYYRELPVTKDWQEFNRMDSGVFLSQFLSGREGINLATADALVFYNIDPAYLSYHQTKNRIQKIDRECRPKLIWLFTEGGLEQKIYRMVSKKKSYTVKVFERQYGI
jgi:hypothetical protein